MMESVANTRSLGFDNARFRPARSVGHEVSIFTEAHRALTASAGMKDYSAALGGHVLALVVWL